MTVSDLTATSSPGPEPAPTPVRRARTRRYVMSAPTHFAVEYAINPWMDPTVPVDADRARAQWRTLRDTYTDLGHTVQEVPALPGLPDMVYAANGGLLVAGHAIVANFTTPRARPRSGGARRLDDPRRAASAAHPPSQRGAG
jgi:hypothetical protein